MKKLLLICLGAIPLLIFGQSANVDDYQSNGNVNFTSATNWQRFNGTQWQVATQAPNNLNGVISIRNGDNATVMGQNVTLDQVVLGNNATLQVTNARTLTILDGTGNDLVIGNNASLTITGGGTLILEPLAAITTITNSNIFLQAGGKATLRGESVIEGTGNFTSSGGATLEISSTDGISAPPAITGNVRTTNTRVFDSGASYRYIGAAPQITGTGLPSTLTGELRINNASGVTLSQATSLFNTGRLNLANGHLFTTMANLLTLGDDVTAMGGSADSYVDGPVKKIGDDAFTFPIGNAGKWAKLGISAPVDASDAFIAEYHREEHIDADDIAPMSGSPSLQRVSKIEYWDLEPETGNITTSLYVTLHWDKGNTTSGITDISTLVVAHYDEMGSTQWENAGVSSSTGTEITGSITSGLFSDFSPFTLGTTAALPANPLPIELSSFYGRQESSSIHLYWSTATEQNNDYMAVERSADGIKFEALGRVKGAGTTQEPQEYTFIDERPLRGINYYRLRQVDFDGAFEYHKTISLQFNGKGSGMGISAFPNPASEILHTIWAASSDQPTTLRVLDMTGRQLAQFEAPAGTSFFEIPLSGLPAGVYFLQVQHGTEVEVVRFRRE